MQVFCASK